MSNNLLVKKYLEKVSPSSVVIAISLYELTTKILSFKT